MPCSLSCAVYSSLRLCVCDPMLLLQVDMIDDGCGLSLVKSGMLDSRHGGIEHSRVVCFVLKRFERDT